MLPLREDNLNSHVSTLRWIGLPFVVLVALNFGCVLYAISRPSKSTREVALGSEPPLADQATFADLPRPEVGDPTTAEVESGARTRRWTELTSGSDSGRLSSSRTRVYIPTPAEVAAWEAVQREEASSPEDFDQDREDDRPAEQIRDVQIQRERWIASWTRRRHGRGLERATYDLVTPASAANRALSDAVDLFEFPMLGSPEAVKSTREVTLHKNDSHASQSMLSTDVGLRTVDGPGVEQLQVNHADGASTLIVRNDSVSHDVVRFVVDGKRFLLEPGRKQQFDAVDPRTITFHRGGNLGNRTSRISGGSFVFRVTSEGWELQNDAD